MGAHGPGSFENDDAMDWLAALAQASDLSLLQRAFEPDPNHAFLDAPTGSVVQAAGELVAAGLGKPAADLPDAARAWVGGHAGLDYASLQAPAQALVEALLSPRSELHDLWEESGDGLEPWGQRVEDLLARLA